jgi:hypothetical protein
MLTVASIPYMQYDTWRWLTEDYATLPLKIAQQYVADGLDVRLADVRACMQGGNSTEMNTADYPYHLSNVGHLEVSKCISAAMMAAPGPQVIRGTPASLTAPCTPGDSWDAPDGTYHFYCVKSGQIAELAF